jgi:hypothetical protein
MAATAKVSTAIVIAETKIKKTVKTKKNHLGKKVDFSTTFLVLERPKK